MLKYTDSIRQEILELLAAGARLSLICSRPGMPSEHTVVRWAREDPEFAAGYDAAREAAAERFAEEIVPIADGQHSIADDESTESRRLRIQARQWIAERWFGRKYAPKSRLEADVKQTVSLIDVILNANRLAQEKKEEE